jgi:glycosyltransferase involved in cell wall biosynthesis
MTRMEVSPRASQAMQEGIRAHSGLDLLVVSHACVVPSNQGVFRCLRERGTLLKLVVPDRWSDAYRDEAFQPSALDGMEDAILPARTVGVGRAQRYAYMRNPMRILRRLRPKLLLIEEESYSLAALQWGMAATMSRVDFGVQAAETIDRSFPSLVQRGRGYVLRKAAFVVARSPAAQDLAIRWGARGEVALVPHAVPKWDGPAERKPSGGFTVGYAGRLVPEKGLDDLLAAVAGMETSARLLLVGDGPMRDQLERAAPWVEVLVGRRHEEMDQLFAEMDVLVLPSRTTATWEEQFGRVLVEALWCGTPVVGAESGQIPWVVATTGGGRTYPEGNIGALSRILDALAADPLQRRALANQGHKVVRETFSTEAVATTLSGVLGRAESLRRHC